jgi:hypothetical protein
MCASRSGRVLPVSEPRQRHSDPRSATPPAQNLFRSFSEAGMQRIVAATLAVAALAVATPLNAQQGRQFSETARPEKARRVPVTVALVDRLPHPGAAAVILRQTGGAPRDVIVLQRDSATGARLAAAVMNLLVIREREGDLPATGAVFRVRENAARQGAAPAAGLGLTKRDMRTADAVVTRLRAARPQTVPGLGPARATVLYLPSRAMRDELKAAGRLKLGSE